MNKTIILNEVCICPRCLKPMWDRYPALSRRDNKTHICSDCGRAEALFDFQCSKVPDTVSERRALYQLKKRERSWLDGN